MLRLFIGSLGGDGRGVGSDAGKGREKSSNRQAVVQTIFVDDNDSIRAARLPYQHVRLLMAAH